LSNYAALVADDGFVHSIVNSIIVSLATTVISVSLASFAAYAIARYRFVGRGFVSKAILFSYLIPVSLLFIPIAIIMAQLGLGNSIYGLILSNISFSLPLSTWLLIGYFRDVPRELEEQAMVDGLSRLGALLRIVMPLSAPGLAAVSIFTFTGAWNELLLGIVLITSESQRTVSVALNFMITDDMLPWGPLMAGSTLASFPLMILYFVAQRFIVMGITEGSVKG
jgi:multiple sugar transport system permease protein